MKLTKKKDGNYLLVKLNARATKKALTLARRRIYNMGLEVKK